MPTTLNDAGRFPLSALGLVALAAALLCALPTVEAAAPRVKNIVLIVADDMNNDLGCYGHPLVKTPHLDRLAERGVRFDRAYCQNPVCNPSRASFLSGYRSGIPNKQYAETPFLPDFLQKNGFLTVEFGKVRHGYGPSASARFEREEKHSVKATAQLLLEKRDQPLFVACGMEQTHPGFNYTPDQIAKYPLESIVWTPEPANVLESIPAAAFAGINIQKLADEERRSHIARYYAAISTVDAEVGLLMDALDEAKLWDTTAVVFFSDHGRHLGEFGGVYDKRTLFEDSCRVPLIIAAPGLGGKGPSPRLAELVDVYPTLVELCGLELPPGLAGTSLVPLLADPNAPGKEAAYTISNPGGVPGRSVRTERFRYTQWPAGQGVQLYDHQTDPHEWVNLADDPKHAQTVAEMQKLLAAGDAREVGAKPEGAR